MTDPEDPPRLVDSGKPSALSALLEAARADVGTEKQVSAVGAALAPHFAAPPAAAPIATKAAMSVAAKLSVAAVAVAVGAASAAYVVSSRGHAPSTSIAPPAAIAPVTPAVVLPVAPPSDNGEAPRVDAPLAGGSHAPSLAPHPEAATTEADLLGQAQAALAGDPSRALSLTERHQKRFPNGVLVQEREVIAIEALERLGRKTAAEARAARFLRAFPTSAHRSKIESIVSGR